MEIKLKDFTISNQSPFTLMAGPCAMESRDHAFDMAHQLKEMCQKLNIPLIYKSSFDKANRTSISGKRGLGMDQALQIFSDIKEELDLPLMTDIHKEEQCAPTAEVIDVLQIPAFLCRQTDLLVAAAKTNRIINVKKGQFLSPYDMQHVAQKLFDAGNSQVMLCDRGTSFGYNTLVTDFRGLPIMKSFADSPVVFDATHSVQQPGGEGGSSGGDRRFAPILARAALSIGIAALFLETHDQPDQAISDGPNMVPVDQLEAHLKIFKEIDQIAKMNPVSL